MVLMVVVGIPMYVCSTSSIPIAVALIAKGLSPGAAYVFLVAGPATNAATLAVLSRVLGKRQTVLYVAVLIAGSLVFGPTMEWITNAVGWSPDAISAGVTHTGVTAWLGYGSAGVLAVLIGASLYRRWRPSVAQVALGSEPHGRHGSGDAAEPDGSEGDSLGIVSMNVEGMTCHHCASNVEDAVRSALDSGDVEVDLSRHTVRISGAGEVDRERVAHAIREAGYDTV
jgi:copper chaperone CopZ